MNVKMTLITQAQKLSGLQCLKLKNVYNMKRMFVKKCPFMNEYFLSQSIYRGDINKIRLNLGKAEIATRINFDKDCKQFYQYLNTPEQKPLVLAD